jgi:hypothetical protein
MPQKSEKGHNNRKNPRSAQVYQKENQERNRSRGKQVWIGGSIKEGGHWDRINVGKQERTVN